MEFRLVLFRSADVDLPADVSALIVSPSVVGDRFIQLSPVYKGGAKLPDNAKLGLKRTSTPIELDEIYASLDQITVAPGPDGRAAERLLGRESDSTCTSEGRT